MKRIVNGKLYDTDTAKTLARYDTERISEILYETNSNEWMLACSGDAFSQYAESVGDRWTSGECLKVLTFEEVLAWYESRNLDPSSIEKHIDLPRKG